MLRVMATAAATTTLVGLAALPAHADAIAVSSYQREALPRDVVRLMTNVDLQPTRSGTWVNTPLQVTLPRRGTYILDANVQGRLWGRPPIIAIMFARLWNVTTDSLVPGSIRTVNHIGDSNATSAQIGRRATAPISEEITVTEPTTIRLQAARVNYSGMTTIADVLTGDTAGNTTLRFERL